MNTPTIPGAPQPPTPLVPVIPESAPFTAEQRAWLNGFLAGLFSRAPAPAMAGSPTPSQRPLVPLKILFGSQTGTAEKLAKRAAKAARDRGFAPVVQEMAQVTPEQIAAEPRVIIVTSTYGDGEPPDNARGFWRALGGTDMRRLEATRYSICALGDTNYPRFCQFGKDLDARLESLGAHRAHPRQDCDVDFDQAFACWLSGALGALDVPTDAINGAGNSATIAASGCSPSGTDSESSSEVVHGSKEHPCPARLITNRCLSGSGSAKDVRHFEIALEDSRVTYEVGDALGVQPLNDPALVGELLAHLDRDGEEEVLGRDSRSIPFRLALQRDFEISRIPRPLLEHFASATADETLRRVTAPNANGELDKFLRGRDVIDLMRAHPKVRLAPGELLRLLRKLQPRLYSIASSPRRHPGEVHLCVNVVRYESGSRPRKGVASTFLADRLSPDDSVPVYVHSNPAFRPPPNDRSLIMIGPGTGVAPFRAFLEERQATAATGRNWMFFGDQHAATDFLYRPEMEGFVRDGILHRLDLAWSRDQAGKCYVQHRILEQGAELWRWLDEGATVCVCGDASRMAKDVHDALRQVISQHGNKSNDAADEYLQRLVTERRYCRDVY